MLTLQGSKRVVKSESNGRPHDRGREDRSRWQPIDWEIDAALDGWLPGVYEPDVAVPGDVPETDDNGEEDL